MRIDCSLKIIQNNHALLSAFDLLDWPHVELPSMQTNL